MFHPALERIRAASYVDEDSGRNKRYRIGRPATHSLRAKIASWSREQLPSELDAFLELTTGFKGQGITVDLASAWTGPTGVLAVHDYGNGDCLGLDDEGDRCAVWWIGHDPYGVIFVADSLLDYVTRFAGAAERRELDGDDLTLIRPEHNLEPSSPAAARAREPHPALADLDDSAVVFDFRAARPRTHVDLPQIPPTFRTRRTARFLIAEPTQAAATTAAHSAREADYLVELAFGLVTMERFDDARNALTRALQLDPSSQRARDRMTWLETVIAEHR